MRVHKSKNVFIDTNVLVYDFWHRNPTAAKKDAPSVLPVHKQSFEALEVLRKRKNFKIYIASFSIPRLASILQSHKVDKTLVIKEVERLTQYYNIATLSKVLVKKMIELCDNNSAIKDIEDALQFVICEDANCLCIISDNDRDFKNIFDVDLKPPSQYRSLLDYKRHDRPTVVAFFNKNKFFHFIKSLIFVV